MVDGIDEMELEWMKVQVHGLIALHKSQTQNCLRSEVLDGHRQFNLAQFSSDASQLAT